MGYYSLDIIPETKICLFTWGGPTTLEDLRNNRMMVKAYCQENGLYKAIIDARERISKTTTMESYKFGEEVPKEMSHLSIALVIPKHDDTLEFIGNVAANRGINMKSFFEFDEAHEWINEQ